MRVNSKEYWNERFGSDWKEFEGNGQTQYFATILGEMLPERLIGEINKNGYSICDLGCAEGDSLPVYKQLFINSEISGEDFSERAIEIASRQYPEFLYRVSDIMQPKSERKYPVVICSNVVEHFSDTYKVLCKICERSTKYSIVMIPYRENQGGGKISEHEQVFHTTNIPMYVEENYLIYSKSVKCASIYYPWEQIMLVYSKDAPKAYISDIVENIYSDKETQKIDELTEKIEKLNAQINVMKKVIEQKDTYIIQAQDMCNVFSQRKWMRINHFIQRLKGQLIHGNNKDRQEFKKWLIDGVIKKRGYSTEDGETYNPWALVRNILKKAYVCQEGISTQSDL